MKEFHASIQVVFDAWKKSELRNKDIQTELRLVKDELRTAKEELGSIKDELQMVRGDLQATRTHEKLEALATLASARSDPSPSYAAVARIPQTGQTRDARTRLSGATPPNVTDTLHCTIDTSKVEAEDGSKPSAGTIRAVVERRYVWTGIRDGGARPPTRTQGMRRRRGTTNS
ncbi:transposon I factor [Colletotrichum truncatum]|uniref:Transposon I factor n=1 Tax=Colletotrichum truncatum TaxID=5467 RepID=A0ACC3YCC0_COLTU